MLRVLSSWITEKRLMRSPIISMSTIRSAYSLILCRCLLELAQSNLNQRILTNYLSLMPPTFRALLLLATWIKHSFHTRWIRYSSQKSSLSEFLHYQERIFNSVISSQSNGEVTKMLTFVKLTTTDTLQQLLFQTYPRLKAV